MGNTNKEKGQYCGTHPQCVYDLFGGWNCAILNKLMLI